MTDAREPRPTATVQVRRDGTEATSYGPARGYSRSPFRPGNMANLRHGAYSDRVISAVAADVGVELLEIVRSSPGKGTADEDAEKSPEG